MKNIMKRFENEIKELAIHAKATGFNPDTDDIMKFVGDWVKGRKPLYDEESRDKAKRLVKQFI